MTGSDDANDEEEEYPELTRDTEMPERDTDGDGIKDEGVPSGYSEGIMDIDDDGDDGDDED